MIPRTGHAGITNKLQLHYTIQSVIHGVVFTLVVYTPVVIIAVGVRLWT